MGSVIDYSRCPQCGGIYFSDYNYKTFEEYRFCSRCGKVEDWSLKCDEDGNVCFGEDGKPCYIDESHSGFGSAGFIGVDGIGTIYHLAEPVDKQTISTFHETLEKDPNLDRTKCYLTAWDPDKEEVIAVYGEIPPLFEEEMPPEEGPVSLDEFAVPD